VTEGSNARAENRFLILKIGALADYDIRLNHLALVDLLPEL
jgi:hypothetical protein